MEAPSKRRRRPAKIAGARKRTRGYDGEYVCRDHGETSRDRISELPDHLLATILGHLDTRSSAATSVLARRWRYLWRSVPRLRFSCHDAMQPTYVRRFVRAHRYAFVKPSLCQWRRQVRVSDERLSRLIKRHESGIFERSLRGFLGSSGYHGKTRNDTRIISLVLNCYMKDRYAKLIDRLLRLAICHGVEDLNLRTTVQDHSTGTGTTPYQFPLYLFSGSTGSSLMKLKLGECALNVPVGFNGFKSLVEISFDRMYISEEMIQTLLENCPTLRSFHLNSCLGITNLKIDSKRLELRELIVNNCSWITYIELAAPKLQRFRYTGKRITMVLAPDLAIGHAWLDYRNRHDGDYIKYITEKLPEDFPQLICANIVVSTYQLKNPVTPRALPAIFKSLISLTLPVTMHVNDDLAWVTMLLDAAPLLENFQIQVFANERREQPGGVVWEPTDFEHRRLKQVEMYCFRTRRREMALVRLMLSRAPLLETVTFFRGYLDWHEDWTAEYVESDEDWSRERKSAIRESLAEWNRFGACLEFRP